MSTVNELTGKYDALLKICAVETKPDFSKKVPSEAKFCCEYLLKSPPIDFLIKLFAWKNWLKEIAMENPPLSGEVEEQRAYYDRCWAALQERVRSTSLHEMHALARTAVVTKAGHFSGKLTHSSASDTGLLSSQSDTSQPHFSSRLLHRHGTPIRLDQVVNDSTGSFQRVALFLEKGCSAVDDIPLVAETLTRDMRMALEAGAREGLAVLCAQGRQVTVVDHRLRQVVLPDGEGFVALTPLGAGGISELLKNADFHAKSPDDAQSEETCDLDPIEEEPTTTESAESEEGQKNPTRAFLERVTLPVGGANPQNITLMGFAVQDFFLFRAPQYDRSSSRLYRFLSVSWVPHIPYAQARAVGHQLIASNSPESASVANVARQAMMGSLRALVRDCHKQALDMADLLDDHEEITEDGVRAGRPSQSPLTILDLAIFHRDFSDDYRTAVAEHITMRLHTITTDRATADGPLQGSIDRHRVQESVVSILQEII